jgi:hypothetical protein
LEAHHPRGFWIPFSPMALLSTTRRKRFHSYVCCGETQERSEATKLAAKGIWKDKVPLDRVSCRVVRAGHPDFDNVWCCANAQDSLAELRKAKTSGVLATVGTSPGSSRIDPSPRNLSGTWRLVAGGCCCWW